MPRRRRMPIDRLALADAPDVMTCEEVGRVLLKAGSTIRAQARKGLLPGVRSGNRYLFGKRAVERYVNGEWVPELTTGPETMSARKAA